MKKHNHFLIFLAIVALTFSACNQVKEEAVVVEPINMENLKIEIQALEDAFAAAEKAKDADAVVAYYSEDAVSYGRNKQPTSGRAALRETTAQGFASDSSGGYNVYKVVDLFAEGDTAVEIGSWTQFDSTGVEIENGHYMSYFLKRDGKYECVRDMNATTKPKL